MLLTYQFEMTKLDKWITYFDMCEVSETLQFFEHAALSQNINIYRNNYNNNPYRNISN